LRGKRIEKTEAKKKKKKEDRGKERR